MIKKLVKIGSFFALFGLLGLGIVFVTGASYPDLMFKILVPVSLLLLFAALPLIAASWVLTIYQEVKAKNYLIAALLGGSGLFLILYELRRILS